LRVDVGETEMKVVDEAMLTREELWEGLSQVVLA